MLMEIRDKALLHEKIGTLIAPQNRQPAHLQMHGGLLLAPDVPPYQDFREGPAGKPGKIEIKINTFEAGMCMKTNKSMTKCLKRNGHFRLRFGHLRLTDTIFAGYSGLVTAICNFDLVLHGTTDRGAVRNGTR